MGKQILIIDDEAYVRRLIRMVLERYGYEVSEAGSAEEGLEMLHSASPDAVTVDLMMPGLSGVDLLKAKAVDERIRDVPALIVTAIGMEDQIEEALQLGAKQAISKPFSQSQLIEAIQALLTL